MWAELPRIKRGARSLGASSSGMRRASPGATICSVSRATNRQGGCLIMSSSSLLRLAGLSALLGAVLLVIVGLTQPLIENLFLLRACADRLATFRIWRF